MARAIGVRASLRHLHFSSSQNVFPRRESNPASTFCSFSSFVANCRTQHCARWNPHELVARKLTHTSCQRQGILLLGRELWGDCQGLGSSRRLGGASAFAEGLRWGGGIAKGDRRGFRTSPIMMGRRAAKIATRKVGWWFNCAEFFSYGGEACAQLSFSFYHLTGHILTTVLLGHQPFRAP